MGQVPQTSADWQELLDERFPQGALVTQVLADGTLSGDVLFRIPVLVVVAMRGEWPLIVGLDGENGLDVQLHVATWEEIDRSGHYVARAKMAPVSGARRGEFEISSWLSPALAEALAPVREGQREWLLQIAESAEEEVALEVDTEPSEATGVAESAPVSEDMALTLSHI